MGALVLGNPALRDLIDRDWIEVMQFFPSSPNRDDQVGLLQNLQMLGHRLPRHVHLLAQIPERLPVALVQAIEKQPAA